MKKLPSLAAILLLATALLPACQAETWVGKQAPTGTLEYFDGATSYQGKPTVLEFWATYCEPCKKLIPHLNEVQRKYKDRGLVVVGVSVDFQKGFVTDFRKTTPIEYTVAYDPNQKFSADMKLEVLPYAYVLDKTGKVVWEGVSDELKDATLEAVLK